MKEQNTFNKSQTDWERFDTMSDEDIDFSDCPEITPKMFANSVVRCGLKPVIKKVQVTLRDDNNTGASK